MAKEPLHLDFSDAETQRNRLSEAQAKSIRDLYREASKEVGKWAERAPRVPSDALRKEYLNRLQGEINRELRGIERQLDGTVRNNMTEVVQATVGDAKAFAQNFGLSIQGAYSHVPTDIVRAVASGQLYEGNWTLSKALWLNTVETQRDVQNIVAKGILENRSAYDIAKDLEKYVNPDARKDWDWSKVYPGTRKVIDYNAQRLARTMVSHAYQQAFVRTTQKNPFITKYEWRAADTERTCQLCLDRDGQYFAKDDLPLDHPNGMCTYLAVIEDDFNTIADRLADWAHGAEDPALDNWAKDLYGKDWEAKKAEAQPEKARAKEEKPVVRDEKWADKTFKNLKKNVETTYGKDTWAALRKDILSKPETTQDWIQRWTNKVGFGIDGNKAYFNGGRTIFEQMTKDALGVKSGSSTIRDPFSTFYHELGHYIDTLSRGRIVTMSGSSEMGKEFYKLLQKDYNKLLVQSTGSLKAEIRSALRLNDKTSGVQDAISGLSLNKNRIKWGHDDEYWTRKSPEQRWKEVTSETFANMNMAYCQPGSDQEKAFQQYFPDSYAYFKETWVDRPELFYAKG